MNHRGCRSAAVVALAGVLAVTGCASEGSRPEVAPPVTSGDDHVDVPNGSGAEPVDVGSTISLDDDGTRASAIVGATSATDATRAEATLLATALGLAPSNPAEIGATASSASSASLTASSSGLVRTGVVHPVAARRLPATDAQGTAAGTGYATASALVESAMRSQGVYDGSITHITDEKHVEVASDAGGDAGSLTVDAFVDAAICPGANGVVYGTIGFDARVGVRGAIDRIGAYRVEAEYTAQVDDAARLTTVDYDIEAEASFSMSSDLEGAPDPFGQHLQLTVTGSGPYRAGGGGSLSATATLDRASSGVSREVFDQAADAANTIGLWLIGDLLGRSEKHWRSGPCVEVELLPSAGPEGLVEGQAVEVWIDPVARADDQPTGGVVATRLVKGGASVAPDGEDLPAPATVTYVAGDGTGVVEATATSKRGIGFGKLRFAAAEDWELDVTRDGVTMRSVKCDGAAGEWRIQLEADFGPGKFTGELVAILDPVTLRGPFTVTGATVGGGVTVEQTGTGTLVFLPGDDSDFRERLVLADDTWSANGHAGPGPEMGTMYVAWVSSDQCP